MTDRPGDPAATRLFRGVSAAPSRHAPVGLVPLIRALLLALFGGWLLLKLLAFMGMGCEAGRCGVQGMQLGARLFVGGVLLAALGAAVLSLTGPAQGGSRPAPRLFVSLGAGLTVLVVYVYARSLFNHTIWDLPVSRAELCALWAVVVLLAAFVHRRQAADAVGPLPSHSLLTDLLLLLLLCVVIADREFERVVNLSSDPDLHVFFAHQIERFGAVPFHQRDWGSQSFNYPAGSGVILFIWHQVTALDFRDLVVGLPVLFTLLAALVVVDEVGRDEERPARRLVLQLASLALTAAALKFPLYRQYFHLEGTARQMSVLPAALFLACAVASLRPQPLGRFELIVLPVCLLYVLAVLNPANVVVPALVVSALLLHAWLRNGLAGGSRLTAHLTVLVALPVLLLLEPFYQGLLGLVEKQPVEAMVYDTRFVIKDFSRMAADAWNGWAGEHATILRELAVLFAEVGRPVFLMCLVAYLVAFAVVSRRWRVSPAAGVAVLVFVASLYLVFGLTRSLLDDQRYFLLAPYVFFSMTQYKALLLTLMLVLVLRRVVRWPMGHALAALAAVVLIYPMMVLVRGGQEMYLAPRKDYCGAFGCLPKDDLDLLRAFERGVSAGAFPAINGVPPKVLIPNAPMRTEHESWILPVSSARALPYHEVLPAAFYYFQGEPYYGTATYNARVCERFDRDWLQSKGIWYVYLPSDRDRACVAGMDQLTTTEEVVLRQGDAYLLKLR